MVKRSAAAGRQQVQASSTQQRMSKRQAAVSNRKPANILDRFQVSQAQVEVSNAATTVSMGAEPAIAPSVTAHRVRAEYMPKTVRRLHLKRC
jgi:hypothetical protein